ncbi:MAG: hypothetical protein U0X58_00145 [Flavobacteriaceae bacterium]
MKPNKSAFKGKFFFFVSGIFSLWLFSCDTYQNVSYYDRDGIYSDFNQNKNESVSSTQSSSSNQYKDYFNSLQNNAPNGEIFSDVEQYRSENYTENDSTLVYKTSYPDWGSNTTQTNINYYGSNWGLGWNNYWGWNSAWNWNIGLGWGSWYDPYFGWGWNSWYNPYNYYGWGYNSWYPNYGYGGYYQPAHYGTRSYSRGTYAQPNYSYNGIRNNHTFNSNGRRTETGVRNASGYTTGNVRQNNAQSPRSYSIRTENPTYNQSNNPRPDYNSGRTPNPSRNYNAPRYNNNSNYTPTRSSGGGYSSGGYSGGGYGGGGRSGGGRR